MATSFFNGSFFGGEFFNTPVTPPVTASTIVPAGRASKSRRKVLIGDRLYEVDSLRDVEFILKRMVREVAEPVTKAAKARIRVVDRVAAKLDAAPVVELPLASVEVDWTPLYEQLAMQDRAYAAELIRALAAQEEDDIEALLLLH